MDGLNFMNAMEIIQRLRAHLMPLEQAEFLVDSVEGEQRGARKAAVLLPLFVQDEALHLVFIRRASNLRAHGGEIAFPGGKLEPTDPSLVVAAVRETQEEIGLNPALVELLGVLTPVFTVVTNYIITPVVAFLPQGLGSISLQESEVAELLVFPLASLSDPNIVHTEQWARNGRTRTVHFYDYETHRIWGATGRILAALFDVLAASTTPK